MNDIYEYKARKYKYKYLKLKELRGSGGKKSKTKRTESTTRRTVNKVRKILNSELVPITEKEFNKVIDHTQEPTNQQKNFKKILVEFREYIKNKIEPLYLKDEIIGTINFNEIFYKNDKKINVKFAQIINLIIDNKTILKLKFNKDNININEINVYDLYNKIKFSNYRYINDKKRKINSYNISYAPIILEWFNNIYEIKIDDIKNNKNRNITTEEIYSYLDNFKRFDKYNECNSLKKFREDYKKFILSNIKNDYSIEEIYDNCIKNRPYIKNIDYYSIAMIIYELYKIFINYFVIVENRNISTEGLPKLFDNLKKKYYNHEIEKESFLKDFDLIISVIKSKS